MTTTKLQYLLAVPETEPLETFRRRIVEDLGPRLLAHGPSRLKLTFSAADAPRRSIVPYERERIALFSIGDDADPSFAAERWNARMREAAYGTLSGYRVDEGIPRAYERDWPDGAPTPGVGLLTLLCRKRGLADGEFYRRWFEVHGPLAMRIHPLWCYVRNVVRGTIVEGSVPWDGIVEEHFRTERDLRSAIRFFGGPLRMLPNMVREWFDIKGFLDLATLRNYLVEERWLRS